MLVDTISCYTVKLLTCKCYNTLIGAVILFSSLPYICTMLWAHNTCTHVHQLQTHIISSDGRFHLNQVLIMYQEKLLLWLAQVRRDTSFASELHFKIEFLITNVHVFALYPTVWYYLLLQQLILHCVVAAVNTVGLPPTLLQSLILYIWVVAAVGSITMHGITSRVWFVICYNLVRQS